MTRMNGKMISPSRALVFSSGKINSYSPCVAGLLGGLNEAKCLAQWLALT